MSGLHAAGPASGAVKRPGAVKPYVRGRAVGLSRSALDATAGILTLLCDGAGCLTSWAACSHPSLLRVRDCAELAAATALKRRRSLRRLPRPSLLAGALAARRRPPPAELDARRRALAGPHKQRECLPLALIIRNRLKYALTYKEVTAVVMSRAIKVDGKVRTEKCYPAGFMGALLLPAARYSGVHPFLKINKINAVPAAMHIKLLSA